MKGSLELVGRKVGLIWMCESKLGLIGRKVGLVGGWIDRLDCCGLSEDQARGQKGDL